MHAYLHCLSHSPLVGYVDPAQEVLDEVNGVIASARERIAAFSPELVVLFAPDHYNGFFYDVMPPFCLGVGATAIGDFGSAAGELPVPVELAEACAHAVMKSGIDLAVSYCMQVDHGFAQPLEFLLGGLDKVPVLPVFINGVATPLPGFQRTRMLGEAIGRFTSTLNKRVLFLGSGGLSHQPPVPELAKADAHMRDRLLGSGKDLPASERELRQQRVISAAEKFVEDQRTLHPLNPIWDNQFMTLLEQGRIQASSTRAGTMQQDNGFVALSAVIKMDAQRFTRFFYIQKTAGGGFGLWLITHHLLLHIQFSVLALNEPNPAIHSGIGR